MPLPRRRRLLLSRPGQRGLERRPPQQDSELLGRLQSGLLSGQRRLGWHGATTVYPTTPEQSSTVPVALDYIADQWR